MNSLTPRTKTSLWRTRRWATRITRAWKEFSGDTVSHVLAIGQQLIDAKDALDHGDFTAMLEAELPFTPRTARRFMAITRDIRIQRLSKGTHASLLPPSWMTLYDLTRLNDEEFTEFSRKHLSSETERGEIGEFLREHRRQQYIEDTKEGGGVVDLQALASQGRRFKTILADPPWSFKVYSGKGKQRSAERHYDTMDLDAICALPVAELADENCALFLWSVWPELPGALRVIRSWGFEYKTDAFTWVKQNRSGEGLFWGMGYWTRANTEPCLLATRGAPERLAADVHQVIMAPVGKHSRKPDETHERIERLVAGPRLELFARSARRGWSTWGNELQAKEYEEAAE